MKGAVKALSVVVTVSLGQMAMANVVTDAGSAVVDGVKTVGTTAWDGTKTVAKTIANPGAVSLELGSLGYGVSFAWSANEKTEVVAGWTGGNINYDVDLAANDSIINYKKFLGNSYNDFKGNLNVDADMSNPYVGVRMRPWSNNFTVNTGVVFQDNTLTATLLSTEDTTMKFGSNTRPAPAGSTVKIIAENDTLAPYLSVGYSPNTNKKIGFFGELGAIYTGEWDIRSEVSSSVPNADEVATEVREKAQKKSPEWYPIVKVGATYRF